MTNRERILACLHYKPYDRLPVLEFGFWGETIKKWVAEGHIQAKDNHLQILAKLGFEENYGDRCFFHPQLSLEPPFETKVVKRFPDGSRHVLTSYGAILFEQDGVTSIQAEIDHLLKDRKSWEELYRPRLQFAAARVDRSCVLVAPGKKGVPFQPEGAEFLRQNQHAWLYGLHCGSLLGVLRDWMGIEGLSYLMADDERLLDEMIETVADLSYRCLETVLAAGAKFDCAHFWEDICFKNGPLVVPVWFAAHVGPHYRRITDLLHRHGIDIISVDCDGWIDALIPTWLDNGVNTMFPIEVGTWQASIAPWRANYGRELRGIGGMDKKVFARDYRAVDAEIERLKPLVELGGFIPCPDHRIPPDAKFENVRYYCEKTRKVFG